VQNAGVTQTAMDKSFLVLFFKKEPLQKKFFFEKKNQKTFIRSRA
jgi:hypothetical protein